MTWAVKQKVGNATGKAILLMLANYADDAGECFPSQEKLAVECECSVATVQRWLKAFEAAGAITRRKQYGENGYRRADRLVLRTDLHITMLPSTELPSTEFHNSASNLTPHKARAEPIKEPSSSLRSEDNGRKKAVRLSEGWTLPVEWRADARAEGIPEHMIDRLAADMRDWSLSSPNGAKRDWRATWRGWCRRKADDLAKQREGPKRRPEMMDHFKNFASEIDGQIRDDRGGSGNRDDAPGVPLRSIEHHG